MRSYRQAAVLRLRSGHRSDRFAVGTETVRSVETCLDKILALRLLHQRLQLVRRESVD